jgi:predicted nucleic acid-binding protein
MDNDSAERNRDEMNSILLDTNLLIYAWDTSNRAKQQQSIQIFEKYRNTISLTTQNLSELAAVLLRKNIHPKEISEIVSTYALLVPVLTMEPADVQEALRAVSQYRMSFWDAQIWSIAKRSGRKLIFSEDGPIGQTIEGVRYENPLA